MLRPGILLAVLATVLVLAACGTDSAPATAAPQQPGGAASNTPVSQQPEPTATMLPTTTGAPPATSTTVNPATLAPASPQPPTVAPAATATPSAPQERTTGQVAGVTFAVSEGSKATFTVREQLVRVTVPIDAVLTADALSGEVHLDGRPSAITIDLHDLQSDQANRDRYVRQQMFPQHPTATINIGDVTPLPAGFTEGKEVTAQVKGVLSIRGVEAPMTFDVEARDDGDVVYVVARSSFTWADIGMSAPRAQSVVSVDDTVRVEVLLALRPASA